MNANDFRSEVVRQHGNAFDLENSENELKSGIKLGFEYALNKQLERIGIAASLKAQDYYIAAVEHLIEMLENDLEERESFKKELKQLEASARSYVNKNMYKEEDELQSPMPFNISVQLAHKKFRLVMRLIKEAGYMPAKDAMI